MVRISLLFTLLQLLTLTQSAAQEKWEIQEDYRIYFSGTKAEGTFGGLQGIILFDPDNLQASKFDVSLEVATIATGNKTKDKHARGDSWFDADSFPNIRFVSTSIIKRDNNQYEAIGNLELKGISKEVNLQFSFTRTANSGLFEGDLKVNREDFGIEGNFFGFVVGKDFQVDLNIPVKSM